MTAKDHRQAQPRPPIMPAAFKESDAFHYTGLPAAAFKEMVKEGAMPAPRYYDRVRVYLRAELDEALAALPVTHDLSRWRKGGWPYAGAQAEGEKAGEDV